MGFKVEGPCRVVQFPGDGSSTYYVGQLVAFSAASAAATPGGVVPLAVPSGIDDITNLQTVAGVVVGFNRRTPTYNATWLANYDGGAITDQATQLARDWALNKGMYAIGDPQLLIDVAMVTSETLLEGPIYNNAYGTAPTVVTDTGGADTTGYTTAGTTGAADFTPVAYNCSIYCRTGKNAGLYRTTNDTTNTAPDVDIAFPYDVVAGDTFVRVPLKQGLSAIYISGPGMYINCSLGAATNYWNVIVEKLDLAVAKQEKALFRFCPGAFNHYRALVS